MLSFKHLLQPTLSTSSNTLSERDARRAAERAVAERRIREAETGIERVFEAQMFNGGTDAPDWALYRRESWSWDVPDDGKWHVDPKWPELSIKIAFDDKESGMRSAHFKALKDVTIETHRHTDACEIVTVASGLVWFSVGNQTFKVVTGGWCKIAAGTPHDAYIAEGTIFTLLYERLGKCDFCLHKLGKRFITTDVECNR